MDPTREPGLEEDAIRTMLEATRVPIVAVVNKSDLPEKGRPYRTENLDADVGQQMTIEISAQRGRDLDRLVDALFDIMPEGPRMYPDLQITDIRHKDWLEELIREKVFLSLEQELPYSTKVTVEDIEEREDGSRYVQAAILTTDERYQRMIIGAKGSKIKEIGMKARRELEVALQAKVYLDLTVKVDPKWQERFS
jgi:GTP-binding protein Era